MGFFDSLMDLLFPPRCAFCKSLLGRGERGMCPKCERDLPFTTNGAEQSGEFYKACIAPLYYEDNVRESIIRFKFKEATAYAKLYGRLMADCIRERYEGRYDLITWVPLSDKRRKKRGYDQAMLLALAVALELGDVAVETLAKHTDVPAQSGAGDEEKRKANISGVYRVVDEELIMGKRILMIDDIVTTGSTLSECAYTLQLVGAKEVICCTLACARD